LAGIAGAELAGAAGLLAGGFGAAAGADALEATGVEGDAAAAASAFFERELFFGALAVLALGFVLAAVSAEAAVSAADFLERLFLDVEAVVEPGALSVADSAFLDLLVLVDLVDFKAASSAAAA
jgi:hypothetical protein